MKQSPQIPIHSGFGMHTPAKEVLEGYDLSGQTYIITGGYSGIGVESVRALAGAGADVIVPARNLEKAEKNLADLQLETPGSITIAAMDLGDLDSVRKFTHEFNDSYAHLNGLINNAGVMACPLQRIGTDWELQFATCHIGHFELTRGLETLLKNTENARVVALSSTAHMRCDVKWDDPHFHNSAYDKWEAYGSAKSANALFALGVDQNWQSDGVRAFSVHPGGISTPLQRHLPEEEMVMLGWKNADGTIPPLVQSLFKSPEAGGATAVWCATSKQLDEHGGVYCEDCDIAKRADENSQIWHHAREWITKPESAHRLWAMTEAMIDNV